jgi:bla regulator protein blaR1
VQLRPLIAFGLELVTRTPWLALALTYLAHSLVWALATALLVRVQRLASATRHASWKAALFGPLVSSVLACTATGGFERAKNSAAVLVQELARPDPSLASTHAGTSSALAALCVASLLLGGLRLVSSIIHTRRRLRPRRALNDARLLARVELLRKRTGLPSVKLSETDRVASPLVIGAAEICLPCASLSALSDAELDAVLAHELAHIERGDGLWFPAASALSCMLWLNPVNAWVLARFRASAEFACDDRAVELTGNGLNLARALLQLATTAAFAQRLSLMPSILRSKHALLPRVRRLTSNAQSSAALGSRGERLRTLVLVSALGALLSTLGIRLATAGSNRHAELAAHHHPSMLVAPVLDMADQGQPMAELARREQSVVARLAAIEQLPGAAQRATPTATLVLQLEQELRHIHATELWLEQRLASAGRQGQ